MKFPFIVLSLLLGQVAAVPSSLEARQDVDPASVGFIFKNGCTRKDDIQNSWADAMRLFTSLPNVDFNDYAAIDFFGPPHLNRMSSIFSTHTHTY